jgi:hypothetical protein
MRNGKFYIWSAIVFLIFLSGCKPFKSKTNWRVSLDKKDKKPYGSYLNHKSLQLFFPGSRIVDLSSRFRYSNIDQGMVSENGKSLLLSVGLDFYITEYELERLVTFASEGNEIMIFCRILDSKIEDILGCTIRDNGYEDVPLSEENNNGKGNIGVLSLPGENHKYGFQGRSLLARFEIEADSSNEFPKDTLKWENDTEQAAVSRRPDTLGYVKGKPDFIRYKVGEGHISLHAAPLSVSNYFLLQKNNIGYMEGIYNTLPKDIKTIYWNDYFKRETKIADLSILLKYPATRWAFFLALFGFLIFLLFESKRRQRVIPALPPLENTSVSFVETVGRLYFNKADHSNLAEKMIQHFLEWVRTHYYINTNHFDDQFVQQLTLKSGVPELTVRSLITMIGHIQTSRESITEIELYRLYETIELFYKENKR